MSIPSISMSSIRGAGGLLSPQRIAALALAAVLGCQLMVVVDATIVNVALPDMQRALGFSSANLSWVLNAYTLTFGGLLLLGARMGDILGRRRTFLAGLSLFVVASMVGGVATDSAMLLASRAVQGIGAAVAAPAALALLMTMFPEGRPRNRAMGLFTAVSVGGFSLGLVLGGTLVQTLDWRWVFYVNVPIGLLVLLLGAVALPATGRASKRFDFIGAASSTLGIGSLVYGLVNAASHGWAKPMTITALAVGVALLVGFVVNERYAAEPITPLRLFANGSRSSAFAGRLVMVAGMMGMMFFLTQFMQDVMHFSPLTTGLAYLPMTAAVFSATQLSARYLVGRFSRRMLLMVGFGLAAVGMLWLSGIDAGTSYASIVVPFILIGFGGGTSFLSLTTASLAGVAPEDSGAASGLVNTMQQLGGTLGLAVLVAVFGAAGGSTSSVHAFTAGTQTAFLVAGVILVGGMLLMFLTQGDKSEVEDVIVEESGELELVS